MEVGGVALVIAVHIARALAFVGHAVAVDIFARAVVDVLVEKTAQAAAEHGVRVMLMARGVEISERTVRLYLQELDAEGLTENLGRRGRRVTNLGRREADGPGIGIYCNSQRD